MSRFRWTLEEEMTAQAPPKVSIGLPVYNGEPFLVETLNSILAQTFADFELIICDNASEDGTQALCEQYAKRDVRIKYHRQPRNLGAQANYDMSFEKARGTYFKWAAHDDLLAPTFLEECVSALDADPGCVLAHPLTVIIDHNGREEWCFVSPRGLESDDPLERLATRFGGNFNAIFGLMRPEVMATTRLHGDFAYSDTCFLAEMALRGRVKIVQKPLFFSRAHSGSSLSANSDPRDLAAWFAGERPKLTFPRTRQHWGWVQAVTRAPLGRRERLRGLGIVARGAFRSRRKILKEWMVPFFLNGRPTPIARALSNLRK